jgi:AraC family transcriptional regulator
VNFASRAEYRRRIEQVVVFIHDHLSDQLDLATVAKQSNFSPYHFHRIFQGAMNETPQDYINRLRVERAANYLTKSRELSITDIAMTCGFASSSTFARAFKKHFGVTARQYMGGRYLRSLADACNSQVCTMATNDPPVWNNVTVKDVPAMHLAYLISMTGYNINEICPTWERLDRWAVAHSAITNSTVRLGISMDDPLITPVNKCRYLAAITIPESIQKDRTVGIMNIPKTKSAIFRVDCRGDQIQLYYQSIYRDWLPDSGMQPSDYPCYEVYRQVPDPSNNGLFGLDIHIPIKPMD